MITTTSLPQIYFYSNLKKLLGNNLAQKRGKNVKRTSLAKQQILAENGGGCPRSSHGTAPSMIFKSRCYAVGL